MQTKHTSTKNGISTQDSSSKTPEQITKDTKKQLKKYDLKPIEQVKVVDPITGETKLITIDRTGTNENKLILALADPELKRDQKDHILSMYLWERGKESSSFIADIFRYKGEHTKETRAFKSQIRFDFEMFISQFSKYVREQSRLIGITLELDIFKERTEYQEWLKLQRERGRKEDFTYLDFSVKKYGDLPRREYVALVEMALYSLEEGEKWVQQIRNVATAREREQGKGIYIDKSGKVYTHDDPDMDEIILADRQREAELQKDES